MRKLCIWISVIMLIALMAVPAFAYEGDGTDSVRYADIAFDMVESDMVGYCEWPFSRIDSSQTEYKDFSLDNDLLIGQKRLDGSLNIAGTFTIPCENKMSLIANYALIRGSSRSVMVYFPADLEILNIKVSGQLLTIDQGAVNDPYRYGVNYRYFDVEVGLTDNETALGYVELSTLIDNAISGLEGYSTNLNYIQNLQVTFSFNRLTIATTSFAFVTSTNVNPADLGTWVRQQDIIVEPPAGDGGGISFNWLLDAVNGFLSIEIAPGFSINLVLRIILIVGLLLWFITLLI